jgi:hypothetical protein
MFGYINGVFADFSQLPEIHQSVLDEIADRRIAMLRSLRDIDEVTYDRISPAVAENTRFLYSGVWAISWARALSTRPRLENSVMTAPFMILSLLAIIIALAGHHVRIENLPTFLASALPLLVCITCAWALARLLRLITRGKLTGIRNTLITAGLVWITSFSATKDSRVSALVQRHVSDKLPKFHPYLKGIDWGTSVHNALWIIACFMVFRVMYIISRYIIKNMTLAHVPKSSSAVLYTSATQDKLLEIAYTIDQHLLAKEKGDIASISHDVRTEIIGMIAEVAKTIEGPWVRSLRTGYRSTDERTAQVGRNIARTVLEWQSRTVFGGQNLRDVLDDCVHAYVKAMDGHWDLISNGEDVQRKSLSARGKDIARRLTAIIFPIILTFVVFRVMPGSWDSYRPYIVLGAVLLTSIQIISLVDPDIVERINTVANVVNSVRRSPKA